MQHFLKLIALRIFPGCAPQIKKCLVEDTFYYLCNDYTISDDGKTINRSSKHIELLLYLGGKVVIHYVWEVFLKEIVDHQTYIGWDKFCLLRSEHFRQWR